MRPRGSYGEVARALCDAASAAPGTVRELAVRAQVGYGLARCTASRLIDAGVLQVHTPGRPQSLALAQPTGAVSNRCDLV